MKLNQKTLTIALIVTLWISALTFIVLYVVERKANNTLSKKVSNLEQKISGLQKQPAIQPTVTEAVMSPSPEQSVISPAKIVKVTTAPVQTSPVHSPAPTEVMNGVTISNIKYRLPDGWNAVVSSNGLMLSPNDGGFLLIDSYKYDGKTGRREFFCSLTPVCTAQSYFSARSIGNLSGYEAHALDNSGGGAEYFAAKGTMFYTIHSYSPPSPNNFDGHKEEVLSSLVF